MISKHIFNSDIISGNILWIDNIQSTGNLVVANDSFNIANDAQIGEDLYVMGDTFIKGDLQVSGDQVIMETHIVKVEDKNIELAVVDTPTNATALNGGITLKGATDKTLNWHTNFNESWNSSENFGVADGKYIFTDKVRARDGAGLLLEDDGGNGITIEDGGNVGINKGDPEEKLHLNGHMLLDNNKVIKWKDSAGTNRHVLQMRSDNKLLLTNNSTGDGGDIVFSTKAGSQESVRITNEGDVGIGTINPGATLDVVGDGRFLNGLTIGGNLTVSGTTTTINSTTLTVDDKNIEMGSVDNPTDSTADGGGITLKGNTDKTITWLQSNNSWNLNQNLSIAAGKHIETEKLKALNNKGLRLEDDGGNGMHIFDGGNVGFSNDIDVTGQANFHGDVYANENVNIQKNLSVTGTSTFVNNVVFEQSIDVSGDFTFNGDNPLEVKNGILEIHQAAGAPTLTTNKLYNVGGTLYWNGTDINTDEDVSVANLKTRLAGGFGGNAVSIGDSNDVITIPGSLVVTGKTTTSHVETVSTSNGVVFEGNALDDHEGTLKAATLNADRTYTLPDKNGTVAMTSDITAAAPSTATSTVQGLIKLASDTDQTVAANTATSVAQRTYGVQLNSSNQAVVNVPWTDTQLTNEEVRTAVGGSFPTYGSAQNGKVLKVVNGNLSWQLDLDESVTNPGGANTQVQFNNSGSFAGSANLTFDGTNLSCNGDVIAYASSDERLKNNISNISSPIEKIKQINGVNFEWSKDQSVYSGKDVGVIAQDVQKVLPEVVSERESGYLAVKYEKIIPLLIEAIKDQQKQIEDLKKKLS